MPGTTAGASEYARPLGSDMLIDRSEPPLPAMLAVTWSSRVLTMEATFSPPVTPLWKVSCPYASWQMYAFQSVRVSVSDAGATRSVTKDRSHC